MVVSLSFILLPSCLKTSMEKILVPPVIQQTHSGVIHNRKTNAEFRYIFCTLFMFKWSVSDKNFLFLFLLFFLVKLLLPNQTFCCSVAVLSDSLQSHRLQYTRLPCSSLSPDVCSNSSPLSQWCLGHRKQNKTKLYVCVCVCVCVCVWREGGEGGVGS